MTQNHHLKTVSDSRFQKDVLESSIPVLVECGAIWCGPCHIIAPAIEELAVDFEGKVNVVKLDVDKNSHTASRYGIRSLPIFLFFNNGQLVDQVIGVISKKKLADRLNVVMKASTGTKQGN